MTGEVLNLARFSVLACKKAYDAPNLTMANAQAYIGLDHSKRLGVLAFAGTNDLRDAANDVSVWGRVSVGRSRIHRGFYLHAKEISYEARRMVADLALPADYRFLITGHSLGAAVAVIEMFRHPSFWPTPATGVLFGCPRVGNAAFSKAFGMSVPFGVWRFVSKGDPVASIPWHWFGRWSHVGQEVVIGEGWDTSADHPIAAYEDALDEMAGCNPS